MITTPRLDTRRPARRHAFVRTIALITMFLLSGLAGPRVSLHAAPSPPIDPYELLHVFTGPDGLNPIGGLIQGTDGLFYGTTAVGADAGSDCGGVFQMDETGTVIPLHAFMQTDGCVPFGTLVQANDGSFYGTTFRGGANSRGTVFKIDPAGTFTVLHDFAGAPGDGSNPYGALIQATDGAFYGTTTRGGAADRGTAFRMDTTGAVTILHSFGADSDDGTEPWAGLIQASDGNFYGATIYGGNPNPPGCECNDRIPSGTVFQMDSAGNVAIRYNFSGSDGSAPYASLLEVNGVLYGSTAFGGPFADSYHPSGGGLFQMPLGDKLEFFYAFGGDPRDGQVPYGALIKASDGNLYGTTNYGGELVGGTIFKVGPDFSVVTLHAFEWNQSGPPAQPGSGLVGPLVQASDGRIYGSASGVIGFEALIDPGVLFRYSLLTNDQTISFGPLPNKTFGDPAFTVDATASSSLPVTFSASGNCSISGAMVSLTGAGNCTITAYQDGNQSFNPAPSVPQSFQIARAAATLTLGHLIQASDGTPKPVTVTTSPAGLPGVSVTYGGSPAPPSAAGSYQVTASLTNVNYQAANATGTLTLTGPAATVALTVSAAAVTGGTSATGTVTLTNPAPAAGAVVHLSSSATGAATAPATVSIAKGKFKQTFSITTFAVGTAANVIVSASYGSETATALLVVNPPALLNVAVSPASVVGGAPASGTVTLSGPAPAGGASVTLASSQSAAQVTTPVVVAAGQTSASFTIATSPVGAATTAAISATYQGVTRSSNLSVMAPSVSKLMLNPATVKGGVSSTATVTLIGPAPTGGLVVAITSDKPVVAPNRSVTVAAGSTSATVAISTATVSARTTVNITASGGGSSKTAVLTVAK